GSAEGAAAARQRAITRKRGAGIAAGEVDCAVVARCRVIELVESRDREIERPTGGGGCRGGDAEVRGRGSAYADRPAGPGYRCRDGVGRRDRGVARRGERGGETTGAVRECAIGGQHRVGRGARELHRAGVTGRRVVEL